MHILRQQLPNTISPGLTHVESRETRPVLIERLVVELDELLCNGDGYMLGTSMRFDRATDACHQ